jgi:dolichol-phosphate mannosyltransferase
MMLLRRTIEAADTPVGRQAVRFVVVGAASYVLNLTLYSLALVAGLHYLTAATVAFCIGFVFNFVTNRLWTFDAGGGSAGGQLVRFSCVAAVMVALDLLLLRLVVGELGAPKILAQAIIILFLAPLSFLGNRLWAFGGRPGMLRAFASRVF